MSEDISKYGFFIVVCVDEDGKRLLCLDEPDQYCEVTSQFKSETLAKEYIDVISREFPHCTYYSKYVSWNMYD